MEVALPSDKPRATTLFDCVSVGHLHMVMKVGKDGKEVPEGRHHTTATPANLTSSHCVTIDTFAMPDSTLKYVLLSFPDGETSEDRAVAAAKVKGMRLGRQAPGPVGPCLRVVSFGLAMT